MKHSYFSRGIAALLTCAALMFAALIPSGFAYATDGAALSSSYDLGHYDPGNVGVYGDEPLIVCFEVQDRSLPGRSTALTDEARPGFNIPLERAQNAQTARHLARLKIYRDLPIRRSVPAQQVHFIN